MADLFGPLGEEFLVNSATREFQYLPVVTGLANGGFVVSWYTADPAQDGSNSAIKAQVFDAAGEKLGSEFLVNTQAAGFQRFPTITSLENGGFVVAWETTDTLQDGSGTAIKAQVHDASGAKVGPEVLVNSNTASSQGAPSITGLATGGFVVTWSTGDTSQDGSSSAVKAQVFDAGGARQGSEFLVNTEAAAFQFEPRIAGLADGGFVVCWPSSDTLQDGSGYAIKAQLHDASGARQGPEFLVNTQTAGRQSEPVITGLENGGFVVTWITDDTRQDGSGRSIRAQIFDGDGARVGTEFLVNDQTVGDQFDPMITGLENGGFVVTWSTGDPDQDGSGLAIKAQVFDADGARRGSELLVNSEHGDNQREPAITGLPNGGFVVTWTTSDAGQDGSGLAIKARLFGSTTNNQPTAAPDSFVGEVISGNVLGNDSDVDGDTLVVEAAMFITAAKGSVVLLANGDFTYTPASGYRGPDSFVYLVSDGKGGSATGRVSLTVRPVNEAPVLVADPTVTIAENTTAVMTVSANDPDPGQVLSYSLSGADAALFAIDADGALRFVSAPNFEAPVGGDNLYEVTVSVSDGEGGEDSQTIAVTVSNVSGIVVSSNARRFGGSAEEDLMTGLSGPNVIFGFGGKDRIHGGDGDDRLVGGSGADSLEGGKGADQLEGHVGDDLLFGGRGADRLLGGAGNDVMTGGAEQDVFVFTDLFGRDRITDFDADPAGGQDRLDLAGFGITAADFATRVAIVDLGPSVRVIIDGDLWKAILLEGVDRIALVTQDDFLLA